MDDLGPPYVISSDVQFIKVLSVADLSGKSILLPPFETPLSWFLRARDPPIRFVQSPDRGVNDPSRPSASPSRNSLSMFRSSIRFVARSFLHRTLFFLQPRIEDRSNSEILSKYTCQLFPFFSFFLFLSSSIPTVEIFLLRINKYRLNKISEKSRRCIVRFLPKELFLFLFLPLSIPLVLLAEN